MGLRLSWWADENDDGGQLGQLRAEARSDGFAGASSGWFNVEEIEAFAQRLLAYPIPAGERISGSTGYSRIGSVAIDESVAVTVYAVGVTGAIGVHVRLATVPSDGARPESKELVHLEFATNYEALGRFARQLKLLVQGRADVAELE